MSTVAQRPAVLMDELATLPVFFKLRGRRCVMAGGDLPAVWKTELLAAAGANVQVFAPNLAEEMVALAEATTAGSITLASRSWRPSDLAGAALAIGAMSIDAEAEAYRSAAQAAGVPVNVIDKPAYCDFQFGTVVARSPLVIGISTDGAAPVFGQALRARIEAILPHNIRRWAQAAKDWRLSVQTRDYSFRQRRQFWEAFAARALSAGAGEPTLADQAACFAAVDDGVTASVGRLTFVGCRANSTGSLTLDSVAALQSADMVGYDPDVGEAVVGMSRREADKQQLATDLSASSETLAAICKSGRHVVWLGLGDPRADSLWEARRNALQLSGIDPVRLPGLTFADRDA